MRTLRVRADAAPGAGGGGVSGAREGGELLRVSRYSGGFGVGGRDVAPVLKEVSFAVAGSAVTAVVGETGSGKTLVALSIMGLAPAAFRATEGEILFQGRNLVGCPESTYRELRGRKLSMVFQDARAALNPVFSVGRQIGDVYRLHGEATTRRQARALAEEALAAVRIPDPRAFLRRYPHELSGGMAQRVQLAMALSCKPALLILDEPTTGLDVTIQAEILELIVGLASARGMTTLLITHDLGIVAETCQYVVVMHRGEVRETGTSEQVLTDPQDDYTRRLIAASRFEGVG